MMKKIIETIKKNKTFLITTHMNLDADALCSELALANYLRALGKKVSIVNNEEVPQSLHFLLGSEKIRTCPVTKKVNYDVAICLDCGDIRRLGKVQDLLHKNKKLINIDHHVTNEQFGDLNLIKPLASSTSEVLYEIFKTVRYPLTPRIAKYLYVGIMTDTGSFRYQNTTAQTHRIVGELMQYRFSVSALYRQVYASLSVSDFHHLMRLLTRIDTLYRGKVLSVELRPKTIALFSKDIDLRNTIFQLLRLIRGVEIIVIFTQMDTNRTKVNMRSLNAINVAQLACAYGGGGHRGASGFMIKKSLKTIRKEILSKIKKLM